MKRLPVGLVRLGLILLIASTAVAGEVGFVEDFALTKDRAVTLRLAQTFNLSGTVVLRGKNPRP